MHLGRQGQGVPILAVEACRAILGGCPDEAAFVGDQIDNRVLRQAAAFVEADPRQATGWRQRDVQLHCPCRRMDRFGAHQRHACKQHDADPGPCADQGAHEHRRRLPGIHRVCIPLTAARSPDLTTERARWKGPCADAVRAPVVAFAATTRLQCGFVITFDIGGIDRIHRGHVRIVARQRPFMRDQPRRNSDLRFANGLDVAPAVGVSRTPVAPASCSIWRWCSLSWQYRHRSSQLLPSAGLSS